MYRIIPHLGKSDSRDEKTNERDDFPEGNFQACINVHIASRPWLRQTPSRNKFFNNSQNPKN